MRSPGFSDQKARHRGAEGSTAVRGGRDVKKLPPDGGAAETQTGDTAALNAVRGPARTERQRGAEWEVARTDLWRSACRARPPLARNEGSSVVREGRRCASEGQAAAADGPDVSEGARLSLRRRLGRGRAALEGREPTRDVDVLRTGLVAVEDGVAKIDFGSEALMNRSSLS